MVKVISSFLILWILILVLILNNCGSGGSRPDTERIKVRSGAVFSGRWYPSGL